MKKQLKILLTIWFVTLLSICVFGEQIFAIINNNIVQYDQSIDSIDPNTGEKTYRLKVYHWKDGDIVRSKYHFEITKEEIDSIKIVEDVIAEKYKLIE